MKRPRQSAVRQNAGPLALFSFVVNVTASFFRQFSRHISTWEKELNRRRQTLKPLENQGFFRLSLLYRNGTSMPPSCWPWASPISTPRSAWGTVRITCSRPSTSTPCRLRPSRQRKRSITTSKAFCTRFYTRNKEVLRAAVDISNFYPGFESPLGHHVGAKSALLRRFFMLMHKKAPSARSLAPPFQIATACAGLRFGSRCRLKGLSSKPFTRFTWSQSPLCDHAFLCLRTKIVIRQLSPILSKVNPLC